MQQLDTYAASEVAGGMITAIPGGMLVAIIMSTLVCADGSQSK